MPGKSKHGKGKYSVRSKKKRSGRGSIDGVAQEQLVSQNYEPVPKPEDGLLNVFAEGAVPLHIS